MASPRERYRLQLQAEIKRLAWEQVAASGATALSLTAIARELGMSGPALYRYFAGRDELITALIRDAYRSLADAVHSAAGDGADLAGLARAMRCWALADRHRYLLIFGTPVPGYHAPADTVAVSGEVMAVVVDAYRRIGCEPAATPFEDHLGSRRPWAGGVAPAVTLRRALTFWTRVHGVLSLELAGHFEGMDFDPALLFADELDGLCRAGR